MTTTAFLFLFRARGVKGAGGAALLRRQGRSAAEAAAP